MTTIIFILAFFWGAIWASLLQFTRLGRFLALKRTWVTVVIGVGVDLLLVKAFLSWADWLRLAAVIGLSSVGIIARSLINEHIDHNEVMRVHSHPAGK